MHFQIYYLETDKYVLRLEKCANYLRIMYSVDWLFTFYVEVINTLCTILGFSYRASTMCYSKSYQQMQLFL